MGEKTEPSDISKEFSKAVIEGSAERSRRKAPGVYGRLEGMAQPTIGESILRVLKEESMDRNELQRRVKDMAGDLYNERFFGGVLEVYVREEFVLYDESSGVYALGNLNPRSSD